MIPGGTPSLLHERDQWAKSSDFTYTVINGAIGFSNVCQFPYEVYDNGGLVFVLVYAYLVVTLGVPLLYLEFFLGQFCGQSMPQAFGGFPMAKGLGWAMIYGGVLLVIVNTPPMAYTLIYLIECFSQRLPWKWCPGGVGGIHAVSAENYVSNVSCYEITQYQYPCVRVNSTLARRYGSGNYTGPEAVAVQEVTGGPAVVVPLTEYTALRNACIPGNISSQEYYWWKEVLNLTSSIAEPGAIQPRVAISLAVCWFLGFLTIRTGPRSLAKVSAVSVYAKFALLLALCFVAVRLSGALRGVATCLKPDLKKLPKAKTWYSATRLLFYSTGLSLGSTTCFASYNNFQADILMHSVKVSVADFVYSLLGMVFVFSLYGHVAQSYTVPISDVITPGCIQYGFVTFPEIVGQLYNDRIWFTAFYTMMFLLNYGSQMAVMEGVLGTAKDVYPVLRRRTPLTALLACSGCFCVTVPMAFQGGYYVSELVESVVSSDMTLCIGFAQLMVVVYFYGMDKLLGDIKFMFDKPPVRYLPFCLRYTCPVGLVVIGLYSHAVGHMATPSTSLQKFPEWITMFQVCIFAVAVVLIGAFVASELGKHKNDLYGAMEPEPTYGPRDPAEFMRYQITQADRNALPSFLPSERRREVLEMAALALPSNADAETPGSATGGRPSPATPDKPKIVSATSTSFAEGSAGSTPGRHVSDGKSPVSSTKSQTTPKELTKNKSPTRRVGKRRHQ